ncbi:MAG TPA: hypothetical protein VHC22_04800 [Pirellulales bacterium]|nr:hypothetical protein [Pirellulales bacterium]
MRGTVIRGIWLAAGLAVVGCSVMQPRSLRIDSAAAPYRGVTLSYRVDGGQLSEPLTVARIVDGKVIQERLPSSPYPDRSVVRLSIRYPHPDGKLGYALAEMVVETRKPPNVQAQKKSTWQQWGDSIASTAQELLPGIKMSDDIYEAWSLDIAKSDLDRVIAGMSQSGYFVNPSKTTMGVELAARVDDFQANKKWSREPELDILLERLRQEGSLVSYVHPVDTGPIAPAIAIGPYANGARQVSHEQEGPSLMPAGPQNNSYQRPPEAARTSSPLPPPAAITNPPRPATQLPNYTPTPYPPSPPTTNGAPAERAPYQSPAYQPPVNQPGAQGMAPPARYPPQGGGQPNVNPRNRWQNPQQYRRQGAAQQGSPPNASRTQPPPAGRQPAAAQQRIPARMPWQRPANPRANGQAGSPPPQNQPTAPGQDPRRPRMPARYGKQQPNGRFPGRGQQPGGGAPGQPMSPGSSESTYAPNPPSGVQTQAGGYPPGLPQPPQLR